MRDRDYAIAPIDPGEILPALAKQLLGAHPGVDQDGSDICEKGRSGCQILLLLGWRDHSLPGVVHRIAA